MSDQRPLEGLRVVELGQLLAAPSPEQSWATLVLR